MTVDNKVRMQALKIAMDFQRQSEDFLNNMLVDLKEKYKIEDTDWLKISTAFSTLTSREVIQKMTRRA